VRLFEQVGNQLVAFVGGFSHCVCQPA
jgi:hypothetical protein